MKKECDFEPRYSEAIIYFFLDPYFSRWWDGGIGCWRGPA